MTDRNPIAQPRRWPLFVGWLVVNGIGGAVGEMLEVRFQFIGTLVLIGSTVGLAQWCFLRGRLPRAGYWALALALGWPLANLLWIRIDSSFDPLLQWFSANGWLWDVFWLNGLRLMVILGAISLLQAIGLPARWRVLPWWFLINLVGGAVLGAVSATVCLVACGATTQAAGPLATGALLGALGWGSYALITGPIIVRWLRYPENLRT